MELSVSWKEARFSYESPPMSRMDLEIGLHFQPVVIICGEVLVFEIVCVIAVCLVVAK